MAITVSDVWEPILELLCSVPLAFRDNTDKIVQEPVQGLVKLVRALLNQATTVAAVLAQWLDFPRRVLLAPARCSIALVVLALALESARPQLALHVALVNMHRAAPGLLLAPVCPA